MSQKPTRKTVDGLAYLELRRLAIATKRPTDELHQLYALEGFLHRLTLSRHANHFVLKGGMLLAAFSTRRPTKDVDLAMREMDNDVTEIQELIAEIAALEVDDGLKFDTSSIKAAAIRDENLYSGIRVSITGSLATAVINFHVDINVGDPIVPNPTTVAIPRLLGGEINVTAYPIEMVLAEKIVTALERGTANTRWRDFVDISRLVQRHNIVGSQLHGSINEVASFRTLDLLPLSVALEGFETIAQPQWQAWRRKQRLEELAPGLFADLLEGIIAFADPVIGGATASQSWNHITQRWEAV